jgi:hypothetical protein
LKIQCDVEKKNGQKEKQLSTKYYTENKLTIVPSQDVDSQQYMSSCFVFNNLSWKVGAHFVGICGLSFSAGFSLKIKN